MTTISTEKRDLTSEGDARGRWEEKKFFQRKLNEIEKIKPFGNPPAVDPRRLARKPWRFWELWGLGEITEMLEEKYDMAWGPPARYETKWDLNNRSHILAILKLREDFRPQILAAWLDCRLWSVAGRGSNLLVREYMRDGVFIGLKFLVEALQRQKRLSQTKKRLKNIENITNLKNWKLI